MVTKITIAGLMMAFMALSAPMVYANEEGGWHHDKDRMAKVLNLTDDQKKQFDDIRKKQKEAMKGVFDQIKANREAFDTEISKAAPDMNKINDLQSQLKTVQGQMVDNHLNLILETKKILTPEQYAGYMALERAERLEHRHHGFGKDGMHKKDGGKDKNKDEDDD
jgi:Spy/CpxP family protein refolding chaperone